MLCCLGLSLEDPSVRGWKFPLPASFLGQFKLCALAKTETIFEKEVGILLNRVGIYKDRLAHLHVVHAYFGVSVPTNQVMRASLILREYLCPLQSVAGGGDPFESLPFNVLSKICAELMHTERCRFDYRNIRQICAFQSLGSVLCCLTLHDLRGLS